MRHTILDTPAKNTNIQTYMWIGQSRMQTKGCSHLYVMIQIMKVIYTDILYIMSPYKIFLENMMHLWYEWWSLEEKEKFAKFKYATNTLQI